MKVNIKYDNTQVVQLTNRGTTELNTSGKYTSKNIILEVEEAGVETTDATADASKILAGYTAYISDQSKATGTIPTWDGSIR